MSIYATLWTLKFPATGDGYYGCDWVHVMAQGVPQHIGSGEGYEDGDPYASFLPPALPEDSEYMRAVVFVIPESPKGTERSGQEYVWPLLILTGEEYAKITFEELHKRLCDALRGDRPRAIMELFTPGHPHKVVFEDGTSEEHEPPKD